MRILKYFSLLFFTLTMLAACRKDKSNLDIKTLSDFYVDTAKLQTTFETQQSVGTVTIDPRVIYAGTESGLQYLWRLYSSATGGDPNATSSIDTLSRKKILESPISRNPGTYTAELQVKETSTGIIARMRYSIVVNSPRPYGWLVAYETTDNNTDVSLIRTSAIVKTITNDEVMRDIYSAVNGSALPGSPVALISNVAGPNADMLFTTQTGVRLNRPDYRKLQDFNQQFVGNPPLPKPEGMYEIAILGNSLINDGDVYWQYGGLFIGKITVADTKGYKAFPTGYPIYAKNGGFYDKLNRRFIYVDQNVSSAYTYPAPASGSTPRFRLDAIAKDMLFIGVGFGQNGLANNPDTYKYAFFENTDKSKRWFYGINFTVPNQPDLCMIDVSTMPSIFSAVHFELGTLGPFAYYASNNTLYNFAYDLVTNTATNPVAGFTAPAGEVITSIKLFKQPGSGYSATESKSNRIMFVATWNQSTRDGKVYLLNTNPTNGSISSTPLKVFSGFGRIRQMTLKPA